MDLLVQDLCVSYDRISVLSGISLQISKGEAVSIIGPNGAGKTTLLKTISGVLKPLRGTITLEGEDLSCLSADRVAEKGVIQVPEGRQIFASFSVLENLELGYYPLYRKVNRRNFRQNLEFILDLFPEFRVMLHQVAGTLSGGQQQMLAVGRALMSRPKILMLDEPSLGLAPLVVRRIFTALEQLRKEGYTILLVEQNVMLGLTFASRAYVIEVGRIVLSGNSEDLINSPRVKEVYLGEEKLEA